NKWAAIIPVAGYGDPRWAARFAHIPCWCFHGAQDDVVPVEQSRVMIHAIERAGGKPRYTEYRELGHNLSAPVYNDDDLYESLSHHRRPPVNISDARRARCGPTLPCVRDCGNHMRFFDSLDFRIQ